MDIDLQSIGNTPHIVPQLICWDLFTPFVIVPRHAERIITLMWRY